MLDAHGIKSDLDLYRRKKISGSMINRWISKVWRDGNNSYSLCLYDFGKWLQYCERWKKYIYSKKKKKSRTSKRSIANASYRTSDIFPFGETHPTAFSSRVKNFHRRFRMKEREREKKEKKKQKPQARAFEFAYLFRELSGWFLETGQYKENPIGQIASTRARKIRGIFLKAPREKRKKRG